MKKTIILLTILVIVLSGCTQTQNPEPQSNNPGQTGMEPATDSSQPGSGIPPVDDTPEIDAGEQNPETPADNPPETIPEPQIVPEPPAPQVYEYTIEADDRGFYPGDDITVNKGDTVKITFNVRTTNVYYGGLQIKSKYFDTKSIKPGASKTVEFTAVDTQKITSYWPS